MKRFLLHTMLFIFFAGLFYTVAVLLWGTFAPSRFESNLSYKIGAYGHMFTRLKEVKNTKDVDILFLGSSHTYRGFDPRIYAEAGLKSFNLGSSAQTPTQTLLLLQRYLGNLNPNIVIYEVYPETFKIDGVESSLDVLANDDNDIRSVKMAFEINHIKVYNTLLYAFASKPFGIHATFKEPIRKGEDIYIPGGYVEKEVSYFKTVRYNKREIKISQNQLENFSNLISKLKNQGIKVVLVYAPITPSNYSSYINNAYFDSLMGSYSDYYNFNELLVLDDSLHFYDPHHLNQAGVEIFNRKLIEVLTEDGVIDSLSSRN